MIELSTSDIGLAYGTDVIIENITFSVNSGSRVGVIGVNGAGKTTLFSIIRGKITPTSGSVFLRKGATIGVLEQINDTHRFEHSVYDTALEAFTDLINLENRLEQLHIRAEQGDNAAIEAITPLTEEFLQSGGNEYRAKTRSFLLNFGFDDAMQSSPASLLSGGQKTKLMLARLLLSKQDIILLDEPTNHLDISSLQWLESFILSSHKTFMIISHDRYFLDRVTTDTLEIENKTCRSYSGNYSAFREKKRLLDEAALRHYEQQQKEIKRIEAFIENQRRWNRERNIIAAESRMKMLDRMVKLDKPSEAPKGINFTVAPSSSKGVAVLSVRNISKAYGERKLFSNLSFDLRRGNRLFVIGANGCGKSTLMKILTGRETADNGTFELGFNQKIGYYDQDQQLLDDDNTVIDELWSIYAEKSMTEIRSMLAGFCFVGDDVFKKVSLLSGGERARLSIAKMISCGVSLLVLDEPTNHLDIRSKEILEDNLKAYDGTILAVSHDRYFISALADSMLEIDKDGYDSGYCLKKCGYEEFCAECDKKMSTATLKEEPQTKKDFIENKREKNRRRIAALRYETLEKEITAGEELLAQLQKKLDDNEVASDYIAIEKLTKSISEQQAHLEKLYSDFSMLDTELNMS